MQKKLNHQEAAQGSLTNLVILLFAFGMLFFMLWSYQNGNVSYDTMLITTIAMMGSFGPVVALSNLSNNLNQTLASFYTTANIGYEEITNKLYFYIAIQYNNKIHVIDTREI